MPLGCLWHAQSWDGVDLNNPPRCPGCGMAYALKYCDRCNETFLNYQFEGYTAEKAGPYIMGMGHNPPVLCWRCGPERARMAEEAARPERRALEMKQKEKQRDVGIDSYLCIQFWDRDNNEWREEWGHRYAYMDDLEKAKQHMAVLETDNPGEKYQIVSASLHTLWPWKPDKRSGRD